MNMLQINKYFYNRGGSETHVLGLCRLLAARGHNVTVLSSSHPLNERPSGRGYFVRAPDMHGAVSEKIRGVLRIFSSSEVEKALERIVAENDIDVAHVHNFSYTFPLSALGVLRERGIPVVMTLHDYKLACPVSTFCRGNSVCEKCKGGKFYSAALYRCNSGSILGSSVNALELYYYRKSGVLKNVSAFISPSKFLMDKLLEHGFKGSFHHLPNPVVLPEATDAPEGMSVLFAGQLSEIKGVKTLLRAAGLLPGVEFRICGAGPLEGEVREAARRLPNVRYLGVLRHDEAVREMARASVLAFPSEWYENCPMAIVEALAAGRPVVASRLGGMVELVRDGEAGLLFRPGDAEDLASKLERLRDSGVRREMGIAARRLAESEFSEEVFYGRLMEVYREVGARNV